jgi:two-component system, cell cycle sensor histidine kinase and response regulator CckA
LARTAFEASAQRPVHLCRRAGRADVGEPAYADLSEKLINQMRRTVELKKILIVEDEGLIAMDLKRRLEDYGYSVPDVAQTANDAVRMAALHVPDLILMDIRLKGERDGILAAEEVRLKMDIPVIFLSAHADPDTLRRAGVAAPFGYIVKPFGTTDFRAHIEMALYKHDAERRLRRSEAWFRATLQHVGDGVITAGLDGSIDFMNAEAERLTGWTPAEAKGKPVQDVFRIDREATNGSAGNAMTDSEMAQWRDGEMLSRDGSQTLLIESIVSRNRNEDGPLGTVIAFRDVTAQRELERQARQSRSMETVSVMAGALAHDFNNLLTIILGYADMVQTDPKRRCAEVEEIERAAKRAAALARQLLTVSGSDIGKSVVFDLNRLILDSARMLKQTLSPACGLVLKTSAGPKYIYADKGGLQQVLLNLAINARDAMPHGGQLAITTEEDASGGVALSVQDTGAGMDAGMMDRIFEPYFSRKGNQGTGLTMTIVHSIVCRFGGTIEAKSEPGRGSTFRILLPLAVVETERIEIDSGKPSEPAAPGTILLVDDNADIRRLLRRVFESAGFRMLEASCGEDALAVLESSGGSVDLLITDVMMPMMTGPELARKWVTRWQQTRVLFISAFSEAALEDNEFIKSGCAEFIAKPFTPRSLVSKVQSMLARVN